MTGATRRTGWYGLGRIGKAVSAGGLALAALLSTAAHAEAIPMDAEHWTIEGQAQFVGVGGKQAVRLGTHASLPLITGVAQPIGVTFSTGTIEFDVWADAGRDFVQFSFHGQPDGNGEVYYFRTHQNGKPDAMQYTPVVNGSAAWQIFSSKGYNQGFDFNLGHWMHFRFDIYTDSMAVTVDGERVLSVPQLLSSSRTGDLTLAAMSGVYFANFDLVPIAEYQNPEPAPAPTPLPTGLVRNWTVSPAMTEAEATRRAVAGDWKDVSWMKIPVEFNGIDNLSRAAADGYDRHSYIARFIADSRKKQVLPMEFGFSDSVQVYLNGQLLYRGSDVQSSRDPRFLGIVGFWDTLYLPLKSGANEVTFVVTDGTNGGTAAAARFPADSLLDLP